MTPDEAYRYERKFVTKGFSTAEVAGLMRLHPAHFRSAYPPRAINNIYFDTPLWRHYLDSTEGMSERCKIRVRWYGDLNGEVPQPRLEIKTKQGGVGGKQVYALPAFQFELLNFSASLNRALQTAELPFAARLLLRGTRPVLVNRYQRTYLLSADKRFRLTVDAQMHFYNPSPPTLRPYHDEQRHIIELKYNNTPENDQLAAEISRHFPFRLNKSSKYIYGIDLIHGFES